MTGPTEGTSGRALPSGPAPEPGRRWSRRRIVATSVVGGMLLLAVAAWIVYSSIRATVRPEDSVRDYLDLLAAGDFAAASAAVDPATYTAYDEYDGETLEAPVVATGSARGGGDDIVLDPGAIDEAAAASRDRLVVGELRADDDGAQLAPGDALDVDVQYTVAGVDSSTTLRVERLADTWYGFPQWRVVDPLLVPLRVETNLPDLGPAAIASVPVDVSGPRIDGAPQRVTVLYPGAYTVTPVQSEYVAADDLEVTVAGGTAVSSYSDTIGDAASAVLLYSATEALETTVATKAEAFVGSCFGSLPAVGENCPTSLRLRADFAQNVAISEPPTLDGIATYQVDYVDGEATEPPLRATFTAGRFSYSSDGDTDTTRFSLFAWITPTADDVTIEFRSGL
ncbi:hypothetical protein [Herbiconiux sp. A18JL235]|uniref:Uncharacterized protein n=1 Tax=Herbiconiux sp. A18JL235 TaxID=3152363 RepID=A0AB39BFZ0_9MICO